MNNNSSLNINYRQSMWLLLLFSSAKEEQNSVLMLKFAFKDSGVSELQNPCPVVSDFLRFEGTKHYFWPNGR